MSVIWDFVKFLIPLIPIVLAGLLPVAINLKKPQRHKQIFMPIVALIFGIIFLLVMNDISEFLLGLIYSLIDRFQSFIDRFEILHFINDINWAFGIMYVVNTVMLLAFAAIKSLLLPIFGAMKPEKNTILNYITSWFYVYDEEDKKWYLQNKYTQAKRLMKVVYIGVIVFSCLLFSATCYGISREILSVPFYPVFGIIILGECFFFLSGIPKGGEQEDETEIPEEETEEPDYSGFKEIYEKLFGDKLVGTAEILAKPEKNTSALQLLERYLKEAEETDSQEAKLFYRYFSLLAARKDDLDDGYIAAARNIIDGKNVLFGTPFYQDTTEYIFLPVTRHLMQGKKMLVIVGKTGADQGIIDWLSKGFLGINGFDNLWKIDYLKDADSSTKIGILQMKDVYNQKLFAKKAEFLAETSMVIIAYPARLLGTMQMGLSNLVSYIRRGETPQYIAYDRNCDGLVDSLSHVLNSSIEEVAATVVGNAQSTAMIWNADSKGLHNRLGLDTARYLGVGTELGAVAVAGKVSQVDWASYEKFPATDIRWIVSQYYGSLCGVMKIPVSQSELENRLRIYGDYWSKSRGENSFVIAEDEFNNPYEVIRQFTTRATKQSFVHVLSQNYLLRDYLCGNSEIFTNDPKAIPNIVADYQRVRSNTVYRITMRLINGEIFEEEIKEALELIGIETQDVYKDMVDLITYYFVPKDNSRKVFADGIINVRNELVIDPKTRRPHRKHIYSITSEPFINEFLSQLQVVHYIAEDEKDKNLYMNSILYGHIYQKYLPGTFVVQDGKYYEVVSVTRSSGVVVRRAADHITRRRYNRQLRRYAVNGFTPGNERAAEITYGNICIEFGEAEIRVATDGYLELGDYGNIKKATRVSLGSVPERYFPHKNIIRFKLAGADAKVRFTVATMMNELFVSLFPDMHEYIVATTAVSEGTDYEGYIPYISADQDDEYIYVIEDSLIDLGLLINVERYFSRIMEIITDLLCWHNEQMSLPEEGEEGNGDGQGNDGEGDEDAEGENAGGKRSWWQRFKDWLKGIFTRKKKKDDTSEEGEGDTEEPSEGEVPDTEGAEPSDTGEETPSEEADAPAEEETPAEEEAPAEVEIPVTEVPDEEPKKKKGGFWGRIFGKKKKKDKKSEEPTDTDTAGEGEDTSDQAPAEAEEETMANKTSFNFVYSCFDVISDNEEAITGEDDESETVDTDDVPEGSSDPKEKKPYSQRFFMLYGYETVPEAFDLDATYEYLKANGFADNYLKETRESAKNTKRKWYNNRFEPGVHYCDFCGTKLEGKISVLKDGRERCKDCEATAITKVGQFKKLYKQAHKRMEEIFGIKINTKISIRITNAQEIAKEGGYEFTPTPGFDGRALGFAQQLGNGKTRIYLENGAPRLETEKTLVHELTHIWQFENMGCLWQPKDLVAIEGMAVWTEAQYLICNDQKERAEAYVAARCTEETEYGAGMREYVKKYPLREGKKATKNTPFSYPGQNPLRR